MLAGNLGSSFRFDYSNTHSVRIHELICRCEKEGDERKWIALFDEGLGARDFMRQTSRARGGADGPAEFYLKTMSDIEQNGRREGWTGIVEMKEK